MLSSTRQYTFTILFLITSLCVLGISFYSMNMAHRIADVHAPLVDAAMEIKLELTRAHLVFEELVSGDTHVSMDEVLEHTKEARWYANAMVHGGKNNEGTFIPIDDKLFKQRLAVVEESITTLVSLMYKRLGNIENALPGSYLDEQFDEYYDNILSNTDMVENDLLALILKERIEQRKSNYIGFALLCLLLVGVLYYSFFQRSRELKLTKLLRKLATHDELTGLYNRRDFNTTLSKEWNNALRAKTPLAVAMCDIDFFKLYNDRFGHQAGDVCLQEVAKAMESILRRNTDCVARYGGEEFIFVLPVTGKEGAQRVMDRLHTSLADLALEHPASEVASYITLSIGVASIVPEHGKEMSELIAAADKALYQAKEQGRNRTVLA